MKTNIDEPCAGNLQARFFRGSCSNKTQTRGVKLQLLPNSKKEKEKSAKELLENSCKNIYERDENGRTALHYAVEVKTVELLVDISIHFAVAADVGMTCMGFALYNQARESGRHRPVCYYTISFKPRTKCYAQSFR
ncbi:ankyrin repeat domain-containing protein [Wolbachia endosymbiont (group A) of Andrena carantonica]|uniref:ankyrin repeat domain-containing protein n=1 Tax=Wolbachia endosymbiont (group A) of Andrena carantonica TaxID=3066190 RepID=UPI00397C54D2